MFKLKYQNILIHLKTLKITETLIIIQGGIEMKKITTALIGAGNRGVYAYGPYAIDHPNEMQFVAVAEPNAERREMFRKTHGISTDMCFSSWEELLSKPKLADAVLICTMDKMHFEPTINALEVGYHVLLEKPMSVDPKECINIAEYAEKYNRIFNICYVLRYTDFFSTIKKLLDEGRIGKLLSIQHNENVGYWHMAHSFVRGNWRNSEESSPMILQKSCHDMDILSWLTGAECRKISSFGTLSHFRAENAPKGAPHRCLEGCPSEVECPYYAPKLYLNGNKGWPVSAVSTDTSTEAIIKTLKEGPYGRCVYHCDNNVVDHQVVNMEFDGDITAAFTMCAFTADTSRTIKLMGTRGEIHGSTAKNEIEVVDFSSGRRDIIKLVTSKSGHGGGDFGLMRDFIRLVQNEGTGHCLTSAVMSVQSHIMAFAAEKSRVEGNIIDLKDYCKELTTSNI
jgi:predicted dehydrogenase